MSTTMVLVIVLVFGFAVARLANRLRARSMVPTTAMYCAVGVVVGPLVGGLVNDEVIGLLQPFVSLMLGLVGFVMGLSLRSRLRCPGGLEAGLLGGVVAMAAVGAAAYGSLLLVWGPLEGWALLWPAIALAAMAGVTDGTLIDQVCERVGARGPVREMLHAYATATTVVAIATLGLSLALARSSEGSASLGLTPVEWLLAAVGVGVACGLLFHLFIGRWGGDQRTFLATVAVVIFASGMAAGMGISPLLVGAIAGLTVSLVSSEAGRLAVVLERLEQPAVVVILVFAGAMWVPPEGWLWVMPAVYLAVRGLAVRGAAWATPRLVGGLPQVHRVGEGLVPQGGLGVAIAVSFAQVFPEHTGLVLTVGLVGGLVGDLRGLAGVRKVVADAGEIAPVATEGEPA